MKSYIHRIGRTGRAGAKGTAFSYFTTDNSRIARDLIKILQDARQQVPPELMEMSSYGGGGGGGRGYGGGRGGGRGGGHYGGGGGGYGGSRDSGW